MTTRTILCLLFAVGCAARQPAPARRATPPVPAIPDESEGTVDQLRRDADALAPQMTTPAGRAFLRAVTALPHVEPRVVYRTADKKGWLTSEQAAQLPAADRQALLEVKVDEPLMYETKYGSPLAYARALDVLGAHGFEATGGAYADFGYGGIGSLRMMAALGYRATGIDVDPMLPALYGAPGAWHEAPAGGGAVRILDGRFPADPAMAQAVGSGLDLFISKNTLKRGYIHPDRPADERLLIHLGVTDEEFLRSVHDALKPGGWLLIYNICPAPTPPDKPFVPWSDGRSPFATEQLQAAGFDVLEFNRDDTPAIASLAHTLRWDQGEDAMDLVHDLSVLYTLARRR